LTTTLAQTMRMPRIQSIDLWVLNPDQCSDRRRT